MALLLLLSLSLSRAMHEIKALSGSSFPFTLQATPPSPPPALADSSKTQLPDIGAEIVLTQT
jgi:hypothetical protein